MMIAGIPIGELFKLVAMIIAELFKVREEKRQALLSGEAETDREVGDEKARSATEVLAAVDDTDILAAIQRVRDAQLQSSVAPGDGPGSGAVDAPGVEPDPQISG